MRGRSRLQEVERCALRVLQRGSLGAQKSDPQSADQSMLLRRSLQKRTRRAARGQEWSRCQAEGRTRRSLLQRQTAPEDRKPSRVGDQHSPRLVCSRRSSRSKGGQRGRGRRREGAALRGRSWWSWDSSATDLKLHGTLFMKPPGPFTA